MGNTSITPLIPTQNRQESLLRNFNVADLFHAPFTLFLLFEQLALSRYIAAVAFGGHVFAIGFYRGAGDDPVRWRPGSPLRIAAAELAP